MSQEIAWLIYAPADDPELRHGSRLNSVIVTAASPELARLRANDGAPSGERYDFREDGQGWRVVSLNSALEDSSGLPWIDGRAGGLAPGVRSTSGRMVEDFARLSSFVF